MYRNLAKLLKMLLKFWLLKIPKKKITFIWNIAFWLYIYIAKKNCCGESLQPNHEMGQPAKIN
jgi:hypothetical protein